MQQVSEFKLKAPAVSLQAKHTLQQFLFPMQYFLSETNRSSKTAPKSVSLDLFPPAPAQPTSPKGALEINPQTQTHD